MDEFAAWMSAIALRCDVLCGVDQWQERRILSYESDPYEPWEAGFEVYTVTNAHVLQTPSTSDAQTCFSPAPSTSRAQSPTLQEPGWSMGDPADCHQVGDAVRVLDGCARPLSERDEAFVHKCNRSVHFADEDPPTRRVSPFKRTQSVGRPPPCTPLTHALCAPSPQVLIEAGSLSNLESQGAQATQVQGPQVPEVQGQVQLQVQGPQVPQVQGHVQVPLQVQGPMTPQAQGQGAGAAAGSRSTYASGSRPGSGAAAGARSTGAARSSNA